MYIFNKILSNHSSSNKPYYDQAWEAVQKKLDKEIILSLFEQAYYQEQNSQKMTEAAWNAYISSMQCEKYENAVNWCKIAANTGLIKAIYQMGLFYDQGKYVQQDYKHAAFWYEAGVERDDAKSCCNLAGLYIYGNGVKKDPSRSLELFRKGAELGAELCYVNIGYFYKEGLTVNQDIHKAAEYYKKGASAGDPLAMAELGICYFWGRGVEKDREAAFNFLSMAASKGVVKAYEYLSRDRRSLNSESSMTALQLAIKTAESVGAETGKAIIDAIFDNL